MLFQSQTILEHCLKDIFYDLFAGQVAFECEQVMIQNQGTTIAIMYLEFSV
jgi:hypothetical protein